MKGLEFLSIALIGFLAVAAVLSWSMLQIGTQPAPTIKSEADITASTMEGTKKTLSNALVLASHQSSLEVAAAGGSLAGERLWWCNNQPDPPEPDEVLYSMSKKTQALYNISVDAIKGEIEDTVATGASCAPVYEPKKEKCESKDSTECESWVSSAEGGTITVEKEDYKMFYSGNIVEEPKLNRFWWMYYILYKSAKDNLLVRAIQQGMLQECTGPDTPSAKLDAAIEFAVDALEKQFDKYVDCSFVYECGPNDAGTMSCLNYDCAPEFAEELCFDSSKKVLVQTATASARIIIECVDMKYNIPSEAGTENLVWRIKAAIEGGGGECRPIDKAKV